MSKIAVVDWSFVCFHTWQSLPTRKIPWTRPTEAEEGIHRICEWIYALQVEHAWDKLIIAKDTPGYWRHEALADWHRKIPRFVAPDGKFYVLYNGALSGVVKETLEEGGFGAAFTKLDAKQEKALLPTLTVLENWPEDMPEPAWPRYKGNRKKEETWACETPLETYYTIRDRLADRVARLVNGKVIAVKGAEADDVAAVVATMNQHQVVLITGDGDWRQLLLRGEHVRMHDLYHGSRVEMGPAVAEEIRRDFIIKLVGGDSGDNIKGCPRLDRKGRSCLAKDGVRKLLESTPYSEIPKLLDPLYLKKNRMMMSLSQREIPPYIWDGILAELRAPAKEFTGIPWTWEQLGLSDRERERIEVTGGAARIFSQWKTDPKATAEALK